MDQYIDKIGVLIETNQAWAGPITFLLTLGESMVLLGLFIPATALMLLTGGLIGAGTLDPWSILAWGIAGAIVGDALSYALGRGMLFDPRWPWHAAAQLGGQVAAPRQYWRSQPRELKDLFGETRFGQR